ncbi:glycerophosphoinositol permease [Cichlidogyrus casuarinus]|uniref:Glycerophosphoinositol permease n=1 Tax=Cichlidogyrus casuarinus TaxID=1844966 RepID=A0ABD2QCL7_9PLAT
MEEMSTDEHSSGNCCMDTREEIERLKRINATLMQEMTALQQAKDNTEERHKELEEKLKRFIQDHWNTERTALLAEISRAKPEPDEPASESPATDTESSKQAGPVEVAVETKQQNSVVRFASQQLEEKAISSPPVTVKEKPPPNPNKSRQGPQLSSETLVELVEQIIARIRKLIEVANGGPRAGLNTPQLAMSIETAVHEMALMIPTSNAAFNGASAKRMTAALSLIRSSSTALTRHCQQRANNPLLPPASVDVIIKHVHEIARSAKDILEIFQQTNPK